jgi:transposase
MLFHYQIRSYFLYQQSIDMRKGIDSLSGLVRNELGQNPLLGDLFIFINNRKNQIKLLHWQGDGFAVFYKRLERGTYEFLPDENQRQARAISSHQLLSILEGVELKGAKKRTRYSQNIVQN